MYFWKGKTDRNSIKSWKNSLKYFNFINSDYFEVDCKSSFGVNPLGIDQVNYWGKTFLAPFKCLETPAPHAFETLDKEVEVEFFRADVFESSPSKFVKL